MENIDIKHLLILWIITVIILYSIGVIFYKTNESEYLIFCNMSDNIFNTYEEAKIYTQNCKSGTYIIHNVSDVFMVIT